MAEFPAMPLWTDAYLADTGHLTTLEHGAYLLILMAMWRSPAKSLSADDHRMARVARVTLGQWRRMKPTIVEFLRLNEESMTYTQGRLTDEANAVRQKSKSQHFKAKARWLKNKETPDAVASSGQCPRDASLTLNPYHLDSESVGKTESKNGDASGDASADLDALFYRRGKRLLGPRSGGQLTKLKEAVGGPGQGLDVIAQAERKENPVEYVAGVIRARRAKQADPFLI